MKLQRSTSIQLNLMPPLSMIDAPGREGDRIGQENLGRHRCGNARSTHSRSARRKWGLWVKE
jgi:hypothetical protein